MSWLVQLAMALHHMHDRRVLHRDLKSRNIFLKRGIVKVGDFGIAKVLQGSVDQATSFAGASPLCHGQHSASPPTPPMNRP